MTLQVAEPPTIAAAGRATVDRTLRPLRWASLTFAGIFAGFMLAVLVIESALRREGAATYVRVRLVELDGLDRLASVTLLPALVATGLTLVVARRARVRPITPFLVAVILLALVLVVSLKVNLPINAQQRGWDVAHPPANWATLRDRWQLAHLVRTCSAVVAFSLLGAANVFGRTS